MSHKFWGMAVRADQTEVLRALRRWPNEGEARVEPRPSAARLEHGWIGFAMAPHEGWTVFRFDTGLAPALPIHLSRTLHTRVISVDQDDTIGYEHFSVLDAGSLSRLFTREMDVKETVGIDYAEFFQQAKQSARYRFPLGPLRDATEYNPANEDVEMEMEGETFRIFNVVVSDIPVEHIAADLEQPRFRMWAGTYADFDRTMAAFTKTGRGEGPWWKDLV